MVTLTITGVKLQSWSIRVIMGIVRKPFWREKHDGTNIIDLHSIYIDIFSISMQKCNFWRIFLVFTGMMTWFCTKNLCCLDVAYGRRRLVSYNYQNKCFIAIPVTGVSPIWTMEIKQLLIPGKPMFIAIKIYCATEWCWMRCFSYQQMTIESYEKLFRVLSPP